MEKIWKKTRVEGYLWNRNKPIQMVDISGKIQGAIGIIVVDIVLLALMPTIVDQVQGMDTTNWTFTGHEGAEAILGLVPFLWPAMILIFTASALFVLAKYVK